MSNWNDERIERLKTLWADGLSASRIAGELGGFSHCGDGGRSAVIGKVHRLGLAGRGRPIAAPKTPRPPRASTRKVKVVARAVGNRALEVHECDVYEPPEEQAAIDNAIPLESRRTLLELTGDTCRWPVGDPGPDLFFCGAQPIDGHPYCLRHFRAAYQRGTSARRDAYHYRAQ